MVIFPLVIILYTTVSQTVQEQSETYESELLRAGLRGGIKIKTSILPSKICGNYAKITRLPLLNEPSLEI